MGAICQVYSFSCPQAVHRLLGRNASHQLATAFFDEDQYVAHGAVANARGGYNVTYPIPPESNAEVSPNGIKPAKLPTAFSVEEMTAMLLTYGREFSETVAEGKIKDAVITVPSYYSQNERLALIDAAELAGMNVRCDVRVCLRWCIGRTVLARRCCL